MFGCAGVSKPSRSPGLLTLAGLRLGPHGLNYEKFGLTRRLVAEGDGGGFTGGDKLHTAIKSYAVIAAKSLFPELLHVFQRAAFCLRNHTPHKYCRQQTHQPVDPICESMMKLRGQLHVVVHNREGP